MAYAGPAYDIVSQPDTSLDAAISQDAAPLPSVVAVVVAHNPGEWFEEELQSLATQDYPELVVFVVDSASREPVAARVAEVLPQAYVIRSEENAGYASAINLAVSKVEGAQYLLLCHDDVALEPDAVRKMVEESYRSTAGIVTPKMLEWSHPSVLLHLGMTVDRCGVAVERVEDGEVDHGQHDTAVEVFAAPGGCMLVRKDLMDAVGGMDGSIKAMGDDIDFSWRVRIAGGRVVLAPRARVRHLEAMTSNLRPFDAGPDDLPVLQKRHELQAVLCSYDIPHSLLVIPQLVLLSLVEMVLSSIGGQHSRVRAIASGWWWVFTHLSSIREKRDEIHAVRRVDDSQLRRYQLRGLARVSAYAQSVSLHGIGSAHLAKPPAVRGSDEDPWWAPWRRKLPAVTWLPAVVVIAYGYRGIALHHLPTVYQLLPFPGWAVMLHHFFSGYSVSGLSTPAPVSPSALVLGLLSLLLGGSPALAQKVFLLALVPVGVWGIWVASRSIRSRLARTVLSLSYLFIPLAYGDISGGKLEDLVAYAGAPFVVAVVVREFNSASNGSSVAPVHWWIHWWMPPAGSIVRVALVTALFAMFVPGLLFVPLVVAIGLFAGRMVIGGWLGTEVLAGENMRIGKDAGSGAGDGAGDTGVDAGINAGAGAGAGAGAAREALRPLLSCVTGAVFAFVLLAPWSLVSLVSSGTSAVTGVHPLASLPGVRWIDLMKLTEGGFPAGLLSYGFALLALAAVLTASHRWRLRGIVSAWSVAILSWMVIWLSGRGWLGAFRIPSGVLLAVAGVSLCLAIGLGFDGLVERFHAMQDAQNARVGQTRNRRWMGVAGAAAAVLLVLIAWPVIAFSASGRFGLPATGYRSAAPPAAVRGTSRTLWLGSPEVLPSASSVLIPGLAYTVTPGWTASELSLWSSSRADALPGVVRDMKLVLAHKTATLGSLISRYNIHYIVVASALAPIIPGVQDPPSIGTVPGVVNGLRFQSDLSELVGTSGYQVWVNTEPLHAHSPGPSSPWYMAMLAIAQPVLWVLCLLYIASLRRRRRVSNA